MKRYGKKGLALLLAVCLLAGSMMALPVFGGAPTNFLEGIPMSLDQWELENALKPEALPMDAPGTLIDLTEGEALTLPSSSEILLDGTWQLVEGGDAFDRLKEVKLLSSGQLNDNYAAAKAFDGKWAGEGDGWISQNAEAPAYVGLDFGIVTVVNRFVLYSVEGGQCTKAFEVQGSNDGAVWDTIVKEENNTLAVWTATLETPAEYSMYRLYVTDGEQNEGLAVPRILEFQLFAGELTEQNAIGDEAIVTASSEFTGNYAAGELIDGDTTGEGWIPSNSSGAFVPAWAQVDLGTVTAISKVVVVSPMNNPNTAFAVQGSNNGEDWTTFAQTENNTEVNWTCTPTGANWRYLRLYITGGCQSDNVPRVAEWQIEQKIEPENISEGVLEQASTWDADDVIDAQVPGSIHAALYEAGVIENPVVAQNSIEAKKQSFKTWWLRTTFDYNGNGQRVELNFDGVCNRMEVYLNGEKIGEHEGMFGGPTVDITDLVRQGENTLVVKLLPAAENWMDTVVMACTYGWHYTDLPPLGIWNSVQVRETSNVRMDAPFIATEDAQAGKMNLRVDLTGEATGAVKGTLKGSIAPKNFDGKTYTFAHAIDAANIAAAMTRLDFTIPDPQLWWPNGIGDQNLYTLNLVLEDENGLVLDSYTTNFGIKTVEMGPTSEGEHADKYNWVFYVNGKEVFMGGANWCTLDVLMDFSEDKYERFLSLVRDQGVRMVRAWGPGIVETDEFYALCDEYGICVWQEWPMSWASDLTQPLDVMEETVVLNIKRIRNHPSLTVYCGGNEMDAGLTADASEISNDPNYPEFVNTVGRLCFELDGTRVWRRTDPYGTDTQHNYTVYNGQGPIEANFTISDTFIGEFGIGAYPNIDSIAKYAPDEVDVWPIITDPYEGAISFHTPWWTNGVKNDNDVAVLEMYANNFYGQVENLEELVLGTQLAQAVALRHPVERARITPDSTGILYYKLTEVYPGASYATLDYYGAAKAGHYFMQDAYAPLAAIAVFDKINPYGDALSVPVYLADDADALADADWSVTVTAYNSQLAAIKAQTWEGSGSLGALTAQLGEFTLTAEQTRTAPLFIVTDVVKDGVMQHRNYYFVNFQQEAGSLFALPKTALEVTENADGTLTVKNIGNMPAVGVSFAVADGDGDSSAFTADDGYFWLNPGESKNVQVTGWDSGVDEVVGFNVAADLDSIAPSAPTEVTAESTTVDSITLTWSAATDEGSGVAGYTVYRDGVNIAFVRDATTYTDIGLTEAQTHTYTVKAVDEWGNASDASAEVTATVLLDKTLPKIITAVKVDATTIRVALSKAVTAASAQNAANYTLSGGATVSSAVLSADGRTVTLTTSALGNTAYTLTVSGIIDTTVSANVMPSSTVTVETELRGYWPLDEGLGNTVTDVTGYQGSSAVNNAAWTSGHAGSALQLNGASGYVVVENPDLPFADGFTVSLWTKHISADSGFQVL